MIFGWGVFLWVSIKQIVQRLTASCSKVAVSAACQLSQLLFSIFGRSINLHFVPQALLQYFVPHEKQIHVSLCPALFFHAPAREIEKNTVWLLWRD